MRRPIEKASQGRFHTVTVVRTARTPITAATIDALVSIGLTVYGNDHRGHGRSAPSAGHVGDFGAGGFDLLVEDMVRLSRIAQERDPDLPLILLGHSMGSFAAQQYVLEHSGMIDGLVLSGSGDLDGLARLARTRSPPPGPPGPGWDPSISDPLFERSAAVRGAA